MMMLRDDSSIYCPLYDCLNLFSEKQGSSTKGIDVERRRKGSDLIKESLFDFNFFWKNGTVECTG